MSVFTRIQQLNDLVVSGIISPQQAILYYEPAGVAGAGYRAFHDDSHRSRVGQTWTVTTPFALWVLPGNFCYVVEPGRAPPWRVDGYELGVDDGVIFTVVVDSHNIAPQTLLHLQSGETYHVGGRWADHCELLGEAT